MPTNYFFIPALPFHISPLNRHTSCSQVRASAGPILEGDLVIYRQPTAIQWQLAAVVEPPSDTHYEVRPIIQRKLSTESDPLVELFVDWDPSIYSVLLPRSTEDLDVIDADTEQRVIEDRVENPHGEISELCWRVDPQDLVPFKLNIPFSY